MGLVWGRLWCWIDVLRVLMMDNSCGNNELFFVVIMNYSCGNNELFFVVNYGQFLVD